MSFTLGLAILGAALMTGVRGYIGAAVVEERRVRERIRLESAANAWLGVLAAGGSAPREFAFREGDARVEVSSPRGKIDLARDSAEVIGRANTKAGLGIDPVTVHSLDGLAEVSAQYRLDATQEDCLRRAFTYGRGAATRWEPESLPDAFEGRAGDQFDIRASTDGDGVLWLRARLTGSEIGWRVHDYRLLRRVGACAA